MLSRFAQHLFCLIAALLLIQSCGVNSNIMFKTPKGEAVIKDSIPMFPVADYRISIDDKINFKIYTNNGSKLIESMSGIDNTVSDKVDRGEYVVRSNGKVELPVVGLVNAENATVEQFEDTLVKLFSSQYKDPFVQVKVTNQRVIIFPGGGGDAKVIPLANANTTLMEVIASAGGIAERGKANTVKIIRKENGERKIYQLDLSTVQGLKYVDMIVQANDYIYVEPNDDLAKEVIKDIAPIVAILSNLVILYTVITN